MKQKTPNEKKVVEEFNAVMEQLTPVQQKSVKALLRNVDACDWQIIKKRKLLFSCRDYLRIAAEVKNDALETRLEMEELSPKERLMLLPLTVKVVFDELENLKIEALVKDDDLALESLHKIAHESARQLLIVTRIKLEKAAKIAEKLEAWPIPYANNLATKRASEALVKRLRLGTNRVATTDPSNVYSENTEARKWVGCFVELIDELRRKEAWCKKACEDLYGKEEVVQQTVRAFKSLPAPSKSDDDIVAYHKEFVTSLDVASKFKAILETENPFLDEDIAKKFTLAAIALPPLKPDKIVVKAWMKVIRETVTRMHGGFPEKNRKLRGLGLYLAHGNIGLHPVNTTSFESNLRSGIFQRFERTLMSIAKG